MNTTYTFGKVMLGSLLVLGVSGFFGTVGRAQTEARTSLPNKEALSSVIGGLPATVTGDFVIDFGGLPVGQQLFGVALGQGVNGTATGAAPLSLLGASKVYIRGARRGLEGDSNRAMLYDGECGGDAASCSGRDDGGHLYHPGAGNLLIVSQDNDGSNPDDNYRGGQLYVDFGGFGPGAVTVTSLEVVNTVGEGAVVELYADGERLAEIDIPQSEDESELSLVEIDTAGVDLMRVTARGQFAIDNVSFTTP